MAALTVQDGKAGLGDVQFANAAGGGDTVVGGVGAGGWALPAVLVVVNGDASPIDVTVDGLADPVTVAATATGVIPLNGGGKAGTVLDIAYSAVTSVTVAAVRLW